MRAEEKQAELDRALQATRTARADIFTRAGAPGAALSPFAPHLGGSLAGRSAPRACKHERTSPASLLQHRRDRPRHDPLKVFAEVHAARASSGSEEQTYPRVARAASRDEQQQLSDAQTAVRVMAKVCYLA